MSLWPLALVAMLILLGGGPGPAAQRTAPKVADLLALYIAGDHESAVKADLDPADVQRGLERIAPDYLASPKYKTNQARHLLAAFAIDFAATRLTLGQDSGASKLIEWGCAIVRHGSPDDEFDRRWFVASVALLLGPLDPNFLESHLGHAQGRFPAEPRLRLARAVSSEQRILVYAPRPLDPMTTLGGGAERERQAETAIRSFRALRDEAAVRADSSVHLGHLYLELRRDDQALTALADVEQETADADLIYLARLFRGLAYEALDRTAPARAAYRSALEVGPGAHAATMALATMLFRHGDRKAADDLVSRLLVDDNPVDDPWWTYWSGDFRKARQRLTAMREALQ